MKDYHRSHHEDAAAKHGKKQRQANKGQATCRAKVQEMRDKCESWNRTIAQCRFQFDRKEPDTTPVSGHCGEHGPSSIPRKRSPLAEEKTTQQNDAPAWARQELMRSRTSSNNGQAAHKMPCRAEGTWAARAQTFTSTTLTTSWSAGGTLLPDTQSSSFIKKQRSNTLAPIRFRLSFHITGGKSFSVASTLAAGSPQRTQQLCPSSNAKRVPVGALSQTLAVNGSNLRQMNACCESTRARHSASEQVHRLDIQ